MFKIRYTFNGEVGNKTMTSVSLVEAQYRLDVLQADWKETQLSEQQIAEYRSDPERWIREVGLNSAISIRRTDMGMTIENDLGHTLVWEIIKV